MSLSPQKIISIVVVSSYVLKSGLKLVTGFIMGIPVLVADGYHGLFDIAEHGFIVWIGKVAREPDENFPLDRLPLIDLVGLGIYILLFLFAVTILQEALQYLLFALINFGWITITLPTWLFSNTDNFLDIQPEFYLYASGVMLFSYVISEIVYRFQIKKALENNLRDMKADAKELRGDGYLELGTGLGLLSAWFIIQFFSQDTNGQLLNNLSSLSMSIILLVVVVYLMYNAVDEGKEILNNLLNKALEKDKRLHLEETLNKRLPSGCKVISPLICYYRSEQIFIKGELSVAQKMMWSADLIIKNAENISKTFFSDIDDQFTIYSKFSPKFELNKEQAEQQLNNILSECFQLAAERPVAVAFKELRFGHLESAQKWIRGNPIDDDNEKVLSKFILAECEFQKNGVNNDLLKKSTSELEVLLSKTNSPNLKGLLFSWLLIYKTSLKSKTKENIDTLNAFREKVESFMKNPAKTHPYITAELYFSLGFSWERATNYDLGKTRRYYSHAEEKYANSGAKFEIDRLYNTWGHFETLTYSLGDAENHLNITKEIRKAKNDRLGLTYTYGSLGDLYGKMGHFNKSISNYQKDLNLLQQLSISHHVPNVSIKMAEQMLKLGLIQSEKKKIKEAIHYCENAENELTHMFFAYKALCKCYLGLTENEEINEKDKPQFLEEAQSYLSLMVPRPESSYEKAFHERLLGRYHAIEGNYSKAFQHLQLSSEYFLAMRDPLHGFSLGIQSITCQLEILKWKLVSQSSGSVLNDVTDWQVLNTLKDHLESIGGMMGPVKEKITDYLDKIENPKNHSKQVRYLSELIWFLEG